MSSPALDFDVAVIGAGPCGLVLAHELGRRHIRTLVLNERPDTSPHPQAGATQARTMEHYRRLGLANLIRAAGLPPDFKTDVAYFTRFSGYELARMELPASGEAATLVRGMSGSWSAAELPHRCSQMYIERILRDEAKTLASVDMRFGWQATAFTDKGDCVEVEAQPDAGSLQRFTARYLVGADGARGITRKQLGINYRGEKNIDRPFLAGLMYAIYFRSPQVYELIPHRRAWQFWAVNPERRGMMISLDGHSAFVYMTQLRPDEDPEALTDDFAKEIIQNAMGKTFPLKIIARSPWTAGLTLVAERFQVGNVFLGGDAVHLFTPTGGLGYNTAVEDAVNLGWKLAAVVNGWAAPSLLDSYQQEREPLARRNTGYARMFADSIGRFTVPSDLEESSDAGRAARLALGEYLGTHARAEFNIPGITLGGRYDGSPLIISDGSQPPPDSPCDYQPSACPGGRAPHAWLADGRSLYDALGFEFTLLKLRAGAAVEPLVAAAGARRLPLTVLDVAQEGLRDLYGADLALIRPDQIVCWRGDEYSNPTEILDRVTGTLPITHQPAAVSL